MPSGPDETGVTWATRPLTVAIVCSANVCRSPALAALLAQSLSQRAITQIRVVSGGVAADPGSPSCGVIASLTGLDVGEFVARRSRALSRPAIDQADLILTASRVERGAVARLEPSARSRTFTVLEAVALARTRLPEGVPVIPASGEGGHGDLAQDLHSRRPFLRLPSTRLPSIHAGTRAGQALDIPDAHTQDVRHRAVANLLREVHSPLVQLLARFAPAP